jgi:DNA helicase II / ATP-dependent DNA helicase PcrA
MKMDWHKGLNPEQIRAVSHTYGPLLILAGAGSGKTTVLVSRTGRLIDEKCVSPSEITVLTFTNKAAKELKNRVQIKLGDSAKGLWAGTFHSLGLQILRRHTKEAGLPSHFGVIDTSDSQSILRELLKDIRIGGKDKFDLQELLEIINRLRVHRKETVGVQDEYNELAQVLMPKFEKKMQLLGVVDFEGLLMKPLEMLIQYPEIQAVWQNRARQLMVDEFQDTNNLQMQLIEALVGAERNLAVVGDDDQSIYGWRGAEVKNILDFPKRYAPCEVIRLERNYRSTPQILTVANAVIAQNKDRHGKVLKAQSESVAGELPEVFVFSNEEEEADFVTREVRELFQKGRKYSDIAILYRSNSQSGLIESQFRQNQIPYSVSGGTSFFDRKEIKDVLSYLRLTIAPQDVALRRIINTPTRGIGDTSIERIAQYAETNNISFFKACLQVDKIELPDKALESIKSLLAFFESLKTRMLNNPNQAGTELVTAMRELGFRDYLYQTSRTGEDGERKWLWIEILARILDKFFVQAIKNNQVSDSTIREFVDAMDLRQDDSDDEKKDEVSLMTLHSSKGLEFPVVILVGVEEDLLPHRTLGGQVNEERRLFYVGLTRAEEKLILTRCQQRKRHGQMRPVSVSRFLLEMPKNSYNEYPLGLRPVTADQRQNLLSNFLSGLDSKIGANSNNSSSVSKK